MATTKTQDGGQKYGVTVQVAALLVITMQYVQSFVTPGLATVRAAYAGLGIDTVMIQQIQGIPSLMAIFGAILVGILERYMKKKHILILAMVLMFMGSLAAFVPETVEGFWLLLAHRNNYFEDAYCRLGADLVISGHGHGGLVRLPFTDGLVSVERTFFPSYTAGCYQAGGADLFVSRGLGNSGRTFRLFNRPQVAVLTLKREG